MEITYEYLIIAAALIFMTALALLELRYIRGRRNAQTEASLIQDDSYNAVATVRAVAESLQQQGRDTAEADVIIHQAVSAYQRRQYTEAKELADQAKRALHNTPQKEMGATPVSETIAEEGASVDSNHTEDASSAGVPAHAVKKLPANYLESKFIIESAQCMLDDAPQNRKTAAACILEKARDCFDEADYTGALCQAMKAKRTLECCTEPISSTPIIHCSHCGAEMADKDQFCFTCGAKKKEICPGCSNEVKEGDKFCRKCGTHL